MLARRIRPCDCCPYKPIDLLLSGKFKQNGIKLNCFDIDFVVEVGKRIRAVAEVKRYQDAAWYDRFYMPAHEYVALKKVAKCLRCDAYFIIFDGVEYYVGYVDRFEKKQPIVRGGQKVVEFSRNAFKRLSESEFRQFWFEEYGRRLVVEVRA